MSTSQMETTIASDFKSTSKNFFSDQMENGHGDLSKADQKALFGKQMTNFYKPAESDHGLAKNA